MSGKRSGQSGSIGYALESTPGTGVTITQHLPLVSEEIENDIERIMSKAIIADRRHYTSDQWAAGNQNIGGPVAHELVNKGMESLFTACVGVPVKTGAGPYVRTYSPTDLQGTSLTVQVGRPGSGGTVHPFTYAGGKVTSWEVKLEQGEYVTFGADMVFMSEAVTSPALAAPSYLSATRPFTFKNGTVTVGGSAVKVMSATIKEDLGLATDRRYAGTDLIDEPLETDLRVVTLELECEFVDLTHYTRFTAATEHAFVFNCTAGADSLVFQGNAFYQKSPKPAVQGKGILKQKVTLHAVASGADTTAFQVVMTNTVP